MQIMVYSYLMQVLGEKVKELSEVIAQEFKKSVSSITDIEAEELDTTKI